MKRSAIVFLGLMIGFTALASCSNRQIRTNPVAVVEPAETERSEPGVALVLPESVTIEYLVPRWHLQGSSFEILDADEARSEYFEAIQLAPERRAKWQLDEQLKLKYPYSQWDSRLPSWGGAIIREYQCDAGGVRSEGLIWGQQGWADLIDR